MSPPVAAKEPASRRIEAIRLFLLSCFSSPLNAILTVVVIVATIFALPSLVRWLVIDAVWTGSSGRDCAGRDGACWIFLARRAEQLLFGTYPAGERWRILLSA